LPGTLNIATQRRYRLLEEIGRGGFGVVWRAQVEGAQGFRKIVAIKRLDLGEEEQSQLGRRLRDEARVLAMLRHRAIVRVDDLVQLDGRWALVMEHVEGWDLKQLIAQGPLPPRVIAEALGEAAGALDAAHRARDGITGDPLGLVHRDVKPANLRISRAGELKLLDFGICRASFAQREARSQATRVGSHGYLAPERYEGRDLPAGDIFALGVVLAECLLGRALGQLPLRASRYQARLLELSEELRAASETLGSLALDMLAYEPAARPALRHVADLLRDQQALLEGSWLTDWVRDLDLPALEPAPVPMQDVLVGTLVPEEREPVGCTWDDAPAGGVGTADDDEPTDLAVAWRVTREDPGRYVQRQGFGELGRGSIGRVLLAHDEHLGRDVAIKELLSSHGRSDPRQSTRLARFLREARVTGQLEHPSIVPVYELGCRLDGSLYYAMRVVRGRTLGQALADCHGPEQRLRLLPHFVDICQAVAFAHSRGVVHRDLKPDNTMLGEFGETVVLDWGLAKVRDEGDLRGSEIARAADQLRDSGGTAMGTTLGTPRYMSPEQAAGRVDDIDPRSDVWSLGAMRYEILAGRPAFAGRGVGEVLTRVVAAEVPPIDDPAAPADLVAVCNKALSLRRADRYDGAGELAKEVNAWLTGARVQAYEYGSLELLARFARRQRVPLAVAAAGLTLVAILGITSYQQVARERGQALDHLARAQFEGAEAAFERDELLRARALLRSSLQLNDAVSARALADRMARHEQLWSLQMLGQLTAVAWSPDGQQLAVADDMKQLTLLDARDAEAQLLGRHEHLPRATAFSPDGAWVATACFDGLLRAWPRTGVAPVLFEGHQDQVRDLAFSADGNTLLSASSDGSLRWWDVADGGQRRQLEFDQPLRAVDVDARGRVALGGRQGGVWLIEPDGEPQALQPHQGSVLGLDLARDGRRMVTACGEGELRLWDLQSGGHEVLARSEAPLWAARFAADGRLAAAGADGLVRLFGPKGERQLLDQGAPLTDLAFAPDSRKLAATDRAGVLRIWNLDSLAEALPERGHKGFISEMTLSADGTRLATVGPEPAARLWDAHSGDQVAVFPSPEGDLDDVALDARAQLLATASQDGTLRIHDCDAGTARWIFRHPTSLKAVALDPQGAMAAAGDVDGNATIWDLVDGTRLAVLRHDSQVYELAFLPDGRLLSSSGPQLNLWDLQSGTRQRTYQGHETTVVDLAVSPDGRHAAAWDLHRKARYWDLESGESQPLAEAPTSLYALAFSADGSKLAWSADGIWERDLASGESRRLSWDGAASMAYAPDGHRLYVAGHELNALELPAAQLAWLAPLLLPGDPPLLFSHQGWTVPGGQGAPAPQTSAWLAAARAARHASLSQDGSTACLQLDGRSIQAWDLASDSALQAWQLEQPLGYLEPDLSPFPACMALHALPGACVSSSAYQVRLHRPGQPDELLTQASPGAVCVRPDEIALLDGDQLLRLDLQGQPKGRRSVEPSVGIVATPTGYVLSTETYGLQWLPADGPALQLEGDAPDALRALEGPRDTLLISTLDGVVGLWDRRTGELLERAKLHGPAQHLLLREGTVYAATSSGDHLAWNLDALTAPRCQLLSALGDPGCDAPERGTPR